MKIKCQDHIIGEDIIICPKKFEFWQDMPHRIHQRDVFELNNQEWIRYNLNP